MPEVSAADLRRLKALDERLRKARQERQRLTAERSELRSKATTGEREARELGKQVDTTEKKLEAVLAENASLAAKVEASESDRKRLATASLELRAELDAALVELEKARKAAAEAAAEAETLRAEGDRLAERLKLADAQLSGKQLAPVLPASEVSQLVDSFVTQLGSRLAGMMVSEGELRLKVGFGKVGRATGFVVPSAESPPEVRETLHEISVRFGRTPEQLEG